MKYSFVLPDGAEYFSVYSGAFSEVLDLAFRSGAESAVVAPPDASGFNFCCIDCPGLPRGFRELPSSCPGRPERRMGTCMHVSLLPANRMARGRSVISTLTSTSVFATFLPLVPETSNGISHETA